LILFSFVCISIKTEFLAFYFSLISIFSPPMFLSKHTTHFMETEILSAIGWLV
jgi:hypothetical protein